MGKAKTPAQRVGARSAAIYARISADVEGTGLGVAIVHRIVEQHEGRIEVSSPPGQGATFRLTLDAGRSAPG